MQRFDAPLSRGKRISDLSLPIPIDSSSSLSSTPSTSRLPGTRALSPSRLRRLGAIQGICLPDSPIRVRPEFVAVSLGGEEGKMRVPHSLQFALTEVRRVFGLSQGQRVALCVNGKRCMDSACLPPCQGDKLQVLLLDPSAPSGNFLLPRVTPKLQFLPRQAPIGRKAMRSPSPSVQRKIKARNPSSNFRDSAILQLNSLLALEVEMKLMSPKVPPAIQSIPEQHEEEYFQQQAYYDPPPPVSQSQYLTYPPHPPPPAPIPLPQPVDQFDSTHRMIRHFTDSRFPPYASSQPQHQQMDEAADQFDQRASHVYAQFEGNGSTSIRNVHMLPRLSTAQSASAASSSPTSTVRSPDQGAPAARASVSSAHSGGPPGLLPFANGRSPVYPYRSLSPVATDSTAVSPAIYNGNYGGNVSPNAQSIGGNSYLSAKSSADSYTSFNSYRNPSPGLPPKAPSYNSRSSPSSRFSQTPPLLSPTSPLIAPLSSNNFFYPPAPSPPVDQVPFSRDTVQTNGDQYQSRQPQQQQQQPHQNHRHQTSSGSIPNQFQQLNLQDPPAGRFIKKRDKDPAQIQKKKKSIFSVLSLT